MQRSTESMSSSRKQQGPHRCLAHEPRTYSNKLLNISIGLCRSYEIAESRHSGLGEPSQMEEATSWKPQYELAILTKLGRNPTTAKVIKLQLFLSV